MIQVVIKNLSAIQTHSGFFASQAGADEWVAKQKSKGERCPWGRPAWTETLEDLTTVDHPDQFTIEFVDKTAEVAAEAADQADKKQKLQNIKQKFQSADVPTIDDIKQAIRVICRYL